MTSLARIFSRLRRPRVGPAPDWWGPACTCTTHAALRARDALHATLRAEGTRYDAEWPDVIAAEARGFKRVEPWELTLLRAQDVALAGWVAAQGAAAEVGGDLAAMAAPAVGWTWTGSGGGGGVAAMTAPGDWPLADYGEGYEIGPWPDARDHAAKYAARYVLGASSLDLPMVRAAATAYDLGLPVPLRSDPPIYRACLAGHVGVGA